MRRYPAASLVAVTLTLSLAPAFVSAQGVKITPLGSHEGEFRSADRALLFEDPTGVRILYDAGATVAGGTDPRLGDVHAVLLSHGHNDHIGRNKIPGMNSGTCYVLVFTNGLRVYLSGDNALSGDMKTIIKASTDRTLSSSTLFLQACNRRKPPTRSTS